MQMPDLMELDTTLEWIKMAARITQIAAAVALVVTLLTLPSIKVNGQFNAAERRALETQTQIVLHGQSIEQINKELSALQVEMAKQDSKHDVAIEKLAFSVAIMQGMGIAFGGIMLAIQVMLLLFQRRKNGGHG